MCENLSDLVGEYYSIREAKCSTLYHYTSLPSYIKIMEEKHFIASEIRYLTDSMELHHFREIIKNEIRKNKNNTQHRNMYKQLLPWISGRIVQSHPIFIVSFSEVGDLLSQWRSYCKPEQGVSIGFNIQDLQQLCSNQVFRVGKCIYDNRSKSDLAKRILAKIELISAETGPDKNAHRNQSYHSIFYSIEKELLALFALIKHQGFSEEREWRIVSIPVDDYSKHKIFFRSGNNTLIPYLKYDLKYSQTKMVELDRLIIGPGSNRNKACFSLSLFNQCNNISIKNGLGPSRTPYLVNNR